MRSECQVRRYDGSRDASHDATTSRREGDEVQRTLGRERDRMRPESQMMSSYAALAPAHGRSSERDPRMIDEDCYELLSV